MVTRWRDVARPVAVVVSLAFAGCGGGSADGLDRKAVSGKVTLDGAPLAKGVISFDPADGSAGAAPAGGVIDGGTYSIAAADGPTPGKYKVSIRSAGSTEAPKAIEAPGAPPRAKKGATDPIPKKYNAESELTATVGPGGSTTADFELTTK